MHRLALLPAAASLMIAAPVLAQADPHAGMDHSRHTGMAQPADEADPAAQALEAAGDTPGASPPPLPPTDHAADRFFPAARMAAARAALRGESAWTGSALMVDQLEYRARAGRDGYAWKAAGWFGGDINRAVIAAEGEGEIGGPVERAEVRALWRRALDPWFNLEAGIRHDLQPGPGRTYATVGIEGLAPYWFEVEGQVFLSTKGDVHLRLGGSHDVRLTRRWVLQPEAELNAALQDVPELGVAAGFERFELGARLRYEIKPDLAPYIGVHWERSLGGTAGFARAAGERASSVSAVVGLRAWF